MLKLAVKIFIVYFFLVLGFQENAFGQKDYILDQKERLKKEISPGERLEIYTNIAKSYRNLNPYFGLDYIDSARWLAEEMGNQKLTAQIINETGVLYKKLDLYTEAIDQHQKALSIFQQTGDSMGIAFAWANMGNVFLSIGQLEKALKYNKLSLNIKKLLHDSIQIAYSLRTTGLVYQAMKEYDSTKVYFDDAMEIYKDIGDKYDVGNMYYHLGDVNLESGNSQNLALVYFGKALKLYGELENSYGSALASYQTGKAWFQMHNFEMAEANYLQALEIAKKSKTPKLIMDIFLGLSKLNKQQANYKRSLDYFEKYAALRDSLFNESISKNIVEMQAKYKNDEQLVEIALLKKENELFKNEQQLRSAYVIILIFGIVFVLAVLGFFMWRYRDKKRINKQLEEEIAARKDNEKRLTESEGQLKEVNQTKDKFFSIISHDLKSPFGAMKGLVDLLESGFDEMEDGEKKEIVRELGKATTNTYGLLTDLLTWSQAQRGTIDFNPVEINVRNYSTETIHYVLPAARKKNISIQCELPEQLMVFADKEMLRTIIRNLLSNAVKFTSNGGKVEINGRKIPGKPGEIGSRDIVEVSVSDNGVGINKENLDKIFRIEEKFKTKGTNNESGTGLGLVICKEFVEKHNCSIYVASEEGKGATFTFTMPASKTSEVFLSR